MNSMELVPAQGKLRLMLAVPRSGSTLFMQIMAGHSKVSVTSRNVLMGNMSPRDTFNDGARAFKPDYSLFTDPLHPVTIQFGKTDKELLISKEEYGNDLKTGNDLTNECNYRIIPNDTLRAQTKPIFTFRNPIDVFDSWLARGWNDLESFITCYGTALKRLDEAMLVDSNTLFYTYDYMVSCEHAQIKTFQKICDYWGLKFEPEMLNLKNRKLGENFIYRNKQEQKIYTSLNPKGIFDTVRNSSSVLNNIKPHNIISSEQRKVISSLFMNKFQSLNSRCAAIMEGASNENNSSNNLFKRSL